MHHYQGTQRLRSFWGAARISGLSPDSPPLFRRAKTPWSIRIHIDFDPFIHLPFSCCLGGPVSVPCTTTLHPHLQSFLPVTTTLQHSQPRSRLFLSCQLCVTALSNIQPTEQSPSVCLSFCFAACLLIPTVLYCAAL